MKKYKRKAIGALKFQGAFTLYYDILYSQTSSVKYFLLVATHVVIFHLIPEICKNIGTVRVDRAYRRYQSSAGKIRSKIWYLQEWRVQRTAVSIRRDSARDHKTGV